MGSGIGQKGLALCSGCNLYLWGRTLSAFMRPTVCHLRSVHRGFSLLVFLLSPILGRLIHVVALFCFVLHCLSSVVYTHQTATLHGINSLGNFLPRSIPQSLLLFFSPRLLWCMSQRPLMLFLLVQVSGSLTSLSSTIQSMST